MRGMVGSVPTKKAKKKKPSAARVHDEVPEVIRVSRVAIIEFSAPLKILDMPLEVTSVLSDAISWFKHPLVDDVSGG